MYITYRLSNTATEEEQQQTSFASLFDNFNAFLCTRSNNRVMPTNFFKTYTKYVPKEEAEKNRAQLIDKYNVYKMYDNLVKVSQSVMHLRNEDLNQRYHIFKIPKKTGGFRTIEAPDANLKHHQRAVLHLFQNIFRILPHNASFAYMEGRSAKEALEQHQKNKSRWFLKIDIKDFFPSITYPLICSKLNNIFPITPLLRYNGDGIQHLDNCIQICLKDEKLPQGTPISPFLSNIVMTDYDYKLTNKLRWYKEQHFVYTRYADDIIISSKYHFDWKEIQDLVQEILGNAFEIKKEKTRYGSSAGRNWNLGLMLNKDNNITIGWRKKERLRATIHNLFRSYSNQEEINRDDVYHIQGIVSYYRKINAETVDNIINRQEIKWNLKYKDVIKNLIKY